MKAKRYVLVKHFSDEPKPSDLQLVEEDLPPLQNGEFLVEAECLSVDPYMRPYVQRISTGSTMIGCQVARIIESKNPGFPVGKLVVGYFGWRTRTVVNLQRCTETDVMPYKPVLIPDIGDLPTSLCLGVLGMPGMTAYFGFLEICKPKPGETVVVSGAAGAVGSHVGQIAKHVIGMNVIGITGSDAKCKWITEELGFDFTVNYKTENVAVALRKAAPKGVDCYFDNVGGEISSTVIYQMKPFGRISICGSISSYNSNFASLPKCTLLQPPMVFNQLKMEGFVVTRWQNRESEALQKNLEWLRQGKIRYRETVTKGFENMFEAFTGLFSGQNIGKSIVRV